VAKPKFTARNALVSEREPYQTVVNCRAVLHFVSVAIHENARTEDETFGRYLILEAVRDALEDVERALESRGQVGRLEVVNG
jgi:hypothetical protein